MKNFYAVQKLTLTLLLITISASFSWAQVPANYFDSANGLTGSALKQELHDIITNGHSAVSYTPGVWDAFYTTDVYPSPNETIIWDMYSATSNSYDGTAPYYFTVGTDQDTGSGSQEGEYYNREHSFPKSWFGGGGSPQETDLHHVYATDKIVNNKRSSFPFGENNGESFTSLNGSKVGSCTLSGYSGTVFEPIDIYKGDFARMLFYMATRYKDEIPGWVSSYGGATDIDVVFTSTGEFQNWYYDMILSWHQSDPVSQKELNRNNAVYDVQGNANPFINHPEYVCDIWGGCTINPEPSEQPINLTATASSGSQIDLTWTDAGGAELPTGYLIMANTTGTFTAPTDGTDPSTDTDMSDGEGLVKVSHGSGASYDFTGLNGSTTYYFKMWSYANSGGDIDFKLDGTPPMANATTLVAPDIINSEDFSNCASNTWTPGSVTSNADWTCDATNQYVSINAYGSDEAADDYLISPSVNLDNYTGEILSFDSWTEYSDTYYPAVELLYSTNYSGDPATATWTAINTADWSPENSTTWTSSGNVDISGISGTSVNFAIRYTSSGTGGGSSSSWRIADISLTGYQSGPALSADPGSLSGYSYTEGSGPSASQNFSLSATNLDGTDITITDPTNYEVSLDNTNFGASQKITTAHANYDGTALTATTVYVRLKAGLTAGTYNSENITISGGGASNITVANSGEVLSNTPTLSADPVSLSGYSYTEGSGPSASQNFSLSATNLDGTDITITGPTNYEVSLDNTNFGTSQTITTTHANYDGTTLSAITVYVRLKAGLTAGTYNSENVTVSGGGASDITIANSGEVTAASTTCANETFENAGSIGSYSTIQWTGTDGFDWTATDARSDQDLGSDKAIMLRAGSLTNDISQAGGMGIIEFDYARIYTGNSTLQVLVNGTQYGGDITVSEETATHFSTVVDISGNIDLQIQNSGNRTLISNLQWSCYSGSATDTNSEVTAGAGSEPATIASTVDAAGEEIMVFDFTFTDAGTSDGLATIMDEIIITQGIGNDVPDWTNAIAGAYLSGPDLASDLSGTIAATSITFTNAGMISVANGTSETYALKIYLKSDLSAVSDNENLAFALNYSDISVDAAGSSFGSGAPESGSTNVAVDISATEMRYITQPSDVNVGASISPAVETAFTDVNGNIDLDAAGNTVRITASGATLSGSPIDAIIDAAGIASFASLQFSTAGTGLTLSANDLDGVLGMPGGYSKTSTAFNVTEVNACGLEEFHGGTTPPDGWSFTSIGTYTTSGNFGTSSPSLQFDATGDQVTTAEVSDPAQLSFWLKGQTTDAASSLTVEGWDGLAWNIVETISNLPTTGTSITYTTGISGYSKFRFTYTKSAGNLSFDDVYVDCVPCATPTQNASDFVFTNIQGTQMDIAFTLGSDADNALLIAKEGSPVDWAPTDTETYTANSVFGSGTMLGTGNYAVYNGDGSDLAVTLSGLTSNTTYYFTAFVYNNCTGGEQYLISGALTGAQGTQDYVSTGSISGEPFCVTSASTASVSIPFTYGATTSFPTTTTFTAQLSDANGSFASPTDIGSVSSNESGSQTITGTIPAGTASGSEYRIRVNSDSPAHTGTDNGSDLEIINAPENVTSVSATGGLNEVSLSWNAPSGCFDEIIVAVYPISITNSPDNTSGYTVSSSDYNDTSNPNLTAGSDEPVVYSGSGNSVTITGLASAESYYFKIFTRYNTDWSSGVEISEQTISETNFQPGDLVILGYDADISNLLTTGDRVYLATFVPIVPGTSFSYVNSRFEAGAAANVRTMEWRGGSDDPDADPGIYLFTYNGTSNISAGSIIAFDIALAEPQAVYIDETNRTADFTFTTVATGSANINAAKGDQLWLVQGDFTDHVTYHTLNGKVLFGLTVAEAWVPLSDPCSGSTDGSLRESRLHPDLKCFNLDLSAQANTYYYYLNSANHNDSQRNLLTAIMDSTNWDGSTVGDGDLNITEDYSDPYADAAIGKPFTISAGNSPGYWLGTTTNWFDCSNWEGLAVPTKSTNVIINAASANVADIDYTAAGADEFEGIAKCQNLTISGKALQIDANGDVLEIYGDLNINGGSLSMNGINPSGEIYLYGDWNNQSGTIAFTESYGTIYLVGSETQTIYGNGGESFYNLSATTDSEKILQSNIAVSNLLNISAGTLDAGAYDLTGSDLTMSGGILKFAKTGITLPELAGTFNITSGIIELYAAGNQTLKGSQDYYSLNFSNSGTKTISNALSNIDGTVTISGDAVLDTENRTFSGTADLVMTDNALFRMAALNSTLPQLTGNYSLTGGTVELYGSGNTQTHSLRTGVTYNKVELNASAANLNYDEANVILSSGTLTLRSAMNVYSPAVFKTGATSIIEGAGTFNLNDGATLKFGHADGITMDTQTGNIRTSVRNFSENASYGLTGSSSPQTVGNGLPASIINFYLEKTNATDEASLSTVTVNGDMILREGLLKITAGYANPVVLENTSGEGDLTIEDGAVLQIEADAAMTVKGDEFINGDAASRLIIKSDATSTGSLIMNPLNAEATVERYLSGNNWHYMFAPLTQIPVGQYTAEGSSTNYNFYSYIENSADYWDSETSYGTSGWTPEYNNTYVPSDKGYIFNRYNMSDKVYTQSGGVLQNTDVQFPITYTENGIGPVNENGVTTDWTGFDGWNLMGNPFTSAIDWDAVTKTNIEEGVYVFDGTNYQYYISGGTNAPYDMGITLNGGSRYIPAGQGFMVKANTGGGTFTIPATARVHNGQSFWKKSDNSAPNLLRLHIDKDGFTDETVFRTLSKATGVSNVHDGKYDAYKMFSLDKSKPQIFTQSTDGANIYAVNSMTEITDYRKVPIGLYISEAGEYQIGIRENTFENMHLWLEDTHTQDMTNLREIHSWKLNQTAEDNRDRYVLHFNKNSQPESNGDLPNQAFKLNETVYFEIPKDAFTDPDFGDTLTYSASLADGSELPEYLSFDPVNLSFSGEALELGSYKISIKAKDVFNETAENNFVLEIYETSGENDVNRNSISIYPNPADDKLHIHSLSDEIRAVKIVDISGKLITQKDLAEKRFSLDLSALSEGMYFIEIQTISETIRKSFIKQ